MIGDLVELRVYDRDATTLRDTIHTTDDSPAKFSVELGGIGALDMSLPLVQSALATDPDLLTDAIVKVAVRLGAATTPVELEAYLAQGESDLTLMGQTKADEVWSLTFDHITKILDDLCVLPEGTTTPGRDDATERWFNFASIATGEWYVSADWTVPASVRWDNMASTRNGIRPKTPSDWPDHMAYWLWPTDPNVAVPPGTQAWFRKKLTLTSAKNAQVYVTADDQFELWLDGQMVQASENTDPYSWHKTYTYPVRLSAGDHQFAAKVTNTWRTGADNIAGLLLSVYEIDSSGARIDPPLMRTDSGWRCYTGTGRPGWTAAGIMRQIVAEAIAAGIDVASRLTVDFTAAVDSDATDVLDVVELKFAVGAAGSDVAAVLHENGFTVEVRPDLTLKGHVHQGSTSGAVLDATNITRYLCHQRAPLATRLLIDTDEGWVTVVDTLAEGSSDARLSVVSAGGALSLAEGQALGEKLLADYSSTKRTYTADFVPEAGAVPYIDMFVGYTITAPDHTRTATDMRVLSIAGQCGGVVEWTVELEPPVTDRAQSPRKDLLERIRNAVKAAAPAGISGRVRSAAPRRPQLPARPNQDRRKEITFSLNGPLEVGDSPEKLVRDTGLIDKWVVTLTDPGTTDSVVVLYRDGTVIATATVPAGDTSAIVDGVAAHVTAASSRVKAGVTTAGSGAAGLVADAWLA